MDRSINGPAARAGWKLRFAAFQNLRAVFKKLNGLKMADGKYETQSLSAP